MKRGYLSVENRRESTDHVHALDTRLHRAAQTTRVLIRRIVHVLDGEELLETVVHWNYETFSTLSICPVSFDQMKQNAQA